MQVNDCWLIGDPHLGRPFKTGVPIHRRGDREELQFKEFQEQLDRPCSKNIMVGDLFDEPNVSLAIIYRTATVYIEAANKRPTTLFILMAGNHDLNRQLHEKGAFHILKLTLSGVDNIIVVDEPTHIDGVSLFPWQWERTALEQIEGIKAGWLAVGHWDLKDFGGSVAHMCPAKELTAQGYEEIWSGHYHVAGPYDVEGITVNCTGSMQPYTHAEDPSGRLYMTVSLLELESIHPSIIKDRNVRVLLETGEVLPTGIDCLSLTSKRIGEPETLDFHEVGIGDFNMVNTLKQKFEEFEVPDRVKDFIEGKINVIS